MMAYELLPGKVQVEISVVSLCISLLLLGIMKLPKYGKHTKPRFFFQSVLFLISFGQTLIFYYYRQGLTGFHQETVLSDGLGKLPLLIHLCLFVIAAIFGVFELLIFMRERKKHISNRSIKYGIDTLSGGILFARDNGRVLLRNHQMDQLTEQLTGQKLINANELWESIESLQGHIYHINGQNFYFERKKIRQGKWIVQRITVNDLTKLQMLHQELEDRKIQLQDMNHRLREYSKDVLATTVAKERLQTKMRIHDEFGQALIKTKVLLTRIQDNQKDERLQDEVIERWMRTIQVLERGAAKQDEIHGMTYVMHMAEAVNVKLEFVTEIPESEKLQGILPSILIEAITNAIKHGNAAHIWVDIKEEMEKYRISISNDGIAGEKAVEPRGGLKSLKTVLKDIGGSLSIQPVPKFTLQVTIHKDGKEGEYGNAR